MALCWIDGFDAYGPETTEVCESRRLGLRYPLTSQTGTLNRGHIVAGRQLGTALQLSEYLSYCKTPSCVTGDTVIVGVAVKRGHTDQFHVCQLYNNEGSSFSLRSLDASTELGVYRDAILLGTTSGANIDVGAWRYVELKVRWGVTTGTFEVRVDGVTLLNEIDQQTGEIGESYYSQVGLISGFRHGGPYNPNPQFDDFYVCDSTGAINNDFLGDRKVVTLFPSSDVEINFETVEPTGNHYAAVNDQTLDDSSYVESDTPGEKDIYEFDTLPANLGDPDGIQFVTTARATAHNFYELVNIVKVDGTEFDSAANRLNNNYQSYNYLVEVNPSTVQPWALGELENIRAGLKVG